MRMQLVSDVSKWGLLQWPAQSRGRLVVFVLVMTAVTAAVGLWAAQYAIHQSQSVTLNLLLMTFSLMLLLITAFSQAVLVGDLFFGKFWREQIFLGKKPVRGVSEVDTVDDRSGEFVIALIVLFIVNGFALNTAAGGFLGFYQTEGFSRVRLRAEEPAERIAALEDIADPFNRKFWERPGIQDAVIERFADDDLEVQQYALWTAGQAEIQVARPALLAVLGDPQKPAEVRAEAAIALGKLGHDTEARRLLEKVALESNDPAVQVGCLRGLGLMASALSVATLEQLVLSENTDVMLYALWALGRIGGDLAREVVKKHVDAEPTGVFRCAVYDAFKMTANKDDTLWARREFQRVDKEETCERVFWKDRSARTYDIVWGETVRIKLLKIVANTNPFDHEDWIQRLVNDPDESWRVREVADEVIKQMKKAKR